MWGGAMRRSLRSHLLMLTGVTNARLGYPTPARNVHAELAMLGISVRRLARGEALGKAAHLRRAAACDLALDTLAYNSHTTGSDVLWATLPLLTLSGQSFSARVAASLSTSVGVPQTQVDGLKAYEDFVSALAIGS